MPLYVTLMKYTPEAMKNIHEVPERFQQNRQLIESKGGNRAPLLSSSVLERDIPWPSNGQLSHLKTSPETTPGANVHKAR
ncbi:MAG: hypothetical protein ACREOH_08580 [Candidatus Entotheonellia bacterium]